MNTSPTRNPLRICIVTHIYPAHGDDYKGIFVQNVATRLAMRGHEVHVVTPRRPGAPAHEVAEGVHVHRFWFWGWWRGRQLGELSGYPPLTLGTLMLWGIGSAWRTVRRERLDLIHAYWVVPGGLIARLAGILSGRPVVATAAGSDLNVYAHRRLLKPLAGWTLRGLDQLLAAGSEMRRIGIELGCPPDRAQVVPWMLKFEEPPSGDPPPELRCPGPPGERLVYVGNFTPPKRVDTILRAFARVGTDHPEARLTLVGDGELRGDLECLAGELGVADAVHFWGARPPEQIIDIVRGADCLVHCSDHEGLPVAISEALLLGVPVVAAGVGGIPDIVQDGVSGFTVDPDDDAAFAERVGRLLADADLRGRLGDNARRHARRHLGPEGVIARIEAIYRELV